MTLPRLLCAADTGRYTDLIVTSRSVILALLVVLTAEIAWSQDTRDKQLILEARARSDAGIASQDVAAVMAEMDSLYHVTGGYSGFATSRKHRAEVFEMEFEADPPVVYVRSPEFVEVSESRTRASETGTSWGGESGTEGGSTYGGWYAAHWVKTDAGWKIRPEVFVSLFSNQQLGLYTRRETSNFISCSKPSLILASPLPFLFQP